MSVPNESQVVPQRRLGRLPAKSSRKALLFADFFKFTKLPISSTYWQKKTPLEHRSYGNTDLGDCTRAKQAVAITRMERLEQKRTVHITDEEVVRVYTEMSDRLYGGGDNGAYEEDALNEWRNPDTTIRDTDGKPYTIDAYLRIDPSNQNQLKAALALSGPKGIALCLNLPAAYQDVDPPQMWDIPADGQFIGKWVPGSWGGHSVFANGYTRDGIWIDNTWGQDNNFVTWDAVAAYVDEAHMVIDSIDAWRKQTKSVTGIKLALGDIRDAVNSVSHIRI